MRLDLLARDPVEILQNKLAIYWEGFDVWRILIKDVALTDDGVMTSGTTPGGQATPVQTKDPILSAIAVPLPTHGLSRKRHPWPFSSRMSYLQGGSECLAASYGGWRLFLSPELVKKALGCVEGLPSGKTHLDDYTSRPTRGGLVKEVHTPGPYASALYNLLRDAAWLR